MTRLTALIAVALTSLTTSLVAQAAPPDLTGLLVCDGNAVPGKIYTLAGGDLVPHHLRNSVPADLGAETRLQSLTWLPTGGLAFCSGLDRMVYQLSGNRELLLSHGGFLARQVRTDTNGTVYWSGLETPIDNNPLPDGFLYSWNPSTRETRTELTFSQTLVNKDWWGAFDVHQGRIYVATLHEPAQVFELVNSIPRHVATLPVRLTAFRMMPDGSLWACDGRGKLYRFADLSNSQSFSVLLDSQIAFNDFLPPR